MEGVGVGGSKLWLTYGSPILAENISSSFRITVRFLVAYLSGLMDSIYPFITLFADDLLKAFVLFICMFFFKQCIFIVSLLDRY